MSAPAGCQLTGRWRIVEADLWDRGYLDLSGPAMITIGEDNNGEIAFGALQAGLDLSYSPSMVFSTTARSRSLSPITTATRLPSKPTGILLQQPAMAAALGTNGSLSGNIGSLRMAASVCRSTSSISSSSRAFLSFMRSLRMRSHDVAVRRAVVGRVREPCQQARIVGPVRAGDEFRRKLSRSRTRGAWGG